MRIKLRIRPFVTVLLMIIALLAAPSLADTTTSSQEVQPKQWLSLSPRPLNECRYFLVTEFGVIYRCDKPPKAETDVWTTFLAEAGVMRNVSPRTAVGGALFVESGGDCSRFGFQTRYRLWLNSRGRKPSRSSLDLILGVSMWGSRKYAWPFLSGPDDPDLPNTRLLATHYPDLAASIALNWREWLGIVFHAEYIPLDQVGPPPLTEKSSRRTHDTAWYCGLRTGSYGGPLMWVSVAITVIAIAAVFSGSGSY